MYWCSRFTTSDQRYRIMDPNKLNPAHSAEPNKNAAPILIAGATEVKVPPLPSLKAGENDRLSDETEFARNPSPTARPSRWSPCDDI